ncbi:MAG TPA: hypothetical protein VF089_19070, partial [Candidatus Binatia bacterium]
MKTIKKTLLMMVIATVLVAPAGCKKNENGEGSAEQAGRKIDSALQKAGQETGKLIEQLGESMQKVGDNMQDKTS